MLLHTAVAVYVCVCVTYPLVLRKVCVCVCVTSPHIEIGVCVCVCNVKLFMTNYIF